MNHAQLANTLFDCLCSSTPIEPLKEADSSMDIDDAYKISSELLKLRVKNGERVIGKKIGVTSSPVQEMLGVFQPDYGFLTDAMLLPNGVAKIEDLIAPRAEAEIAFTLKKNLKGPGVTADDVIEATDYVESAIEIVDSRIKDWRITIQDTIADNASCGLFVLSSQKVSVDSVNLPEVQVDFYKNGELISQGSGEAVMGNPAEAVAWLANTLGERGVSLNAGEVVLSGSMIPLAPAVKGDVFEMKISELGSCTATFE